TADIVQKITETEDTVQEIPETQTHSSLRTQFWDTVVTRDWDTVQEMTRDCGSTEDQNTVPADTVG
ncbi:unnamed protein product, partial [Staurois parvus]